MNNISNSKIKGKQKEQFSKTRTILSAKRYAPYNSKMKQQELDK